MERLTRYEYEVLRRANERPRKVYEWGAWVGACIETLRGMGLLDRMGRITPKGKERLQWIEQNGPFATEENVR